MTPLPERAQECVRTPGALVQSGLLPTCGARAYVPSMEPARAVAPHDDAVFVPEHMVWRVCVRSAREQWPPWAAASDVLDRGPAWCTVADGAWLHHLDMVSREAWMTRTFEAALPVAEVRAFVSAREKAPAPGQTPASEVARALALLVRIVGNALHGETRPVPLDSKIVTQQLGWDATLEALMQRLGWRVAPIDERMALHPPAEMTSWQAYVELAVMCVHLGGAPPAPEHVQWHIEPRGWPPALAPTVPPPDERIHFACARLGVATHEDAKSVCDMYRVAIECFPHRRQELFLALEYVVDMRQFGEPATTLMAMEQSQGVYAYKDVRGGYERLGVPTPVVAHEHRSLWDEMPPPPPVRVDEVVAAYDKAVQDALEHGTDADLQSARHALRTLAQYHAPAPALDARERANPIQHVADAYKLLQTSPEIDDALLLMGYRVYASESKTRAELLRLALETVAESRASAHLRRFLRGEDDADDERMPRGLYNIGNTCYLNSLLQYIAWITPIREAVHAAKGAAPVPDASDEQKRALAFAHGLDALFTAMETSKEQALTPSKELAYLALVPLAWEQAYQCTKDELMSQVTTQQDVCECLDNMVALLDSACTSDAAPHAVHRLFAGTSLQRLSPPPPDSAKIEQAFTSLPVTLLPGALDMYDALDTFFNEEQVAWENATHVQRSITLQHAPPLLQIHVQRVQYDRMKQRIVKNQAPLDLPDTLYLDRYMDPDCAPPERAAALADLHTQTSTLRRERAALLERVQRLDSAQLSALERVGERLARLGDVDAVDDELRALVHEHSASELADVASGMRREIDTLRSEAHAKRAAIQRLWCDETCVPYRLASVCMHRGEATHGHYFVNQRDFARDEWMALNDTSVSTITAGEVSREYVHEYIYSQQSHGRYVLSRGVCARRYPGARMRIIESAPGRSELAAAVARFASKVKGQVLVADHVLDLAAHRNHKERNEVEHQDGPEYRDIKHVEHGCAERQEDGLRCADPELELWQAADERAELVLVFAVARARVEDVAHEA